MNTNKLTFRNALLIGSLIFGMLFGAGNLIFPVHLGQNGRGALAKRGWRLFDVGGALAADGAAGNQHYALQWNL